MPPKEERYKDAWNNIKLSQPKPGVLFNRRTCAWYWNSKRKDVCLLQGLIDFAKEDYEAAEKHWSMLAELDKEFYEQQEKDGWGNATTHSRLMWNLKNQKGSLYATPVEMRGFDTPQLKLAVLLADLDMENENFEQAEKKYKRILDMLEVRKRKERASYITYALANTLLMQFKASEAMKIYCEFGPQGHFKDMPSAPCALINYANYMTQNRNNLPDYNKGILCYRYTAEQFPDTCEGQMSFYLLGDKLEKIGKVSDAISIWKQYIQKYPQCTYIAHARKSILTTKQAP